MRSHVKRAVSLLLAVLLLPCLAAADLSPDLQKALTDSKYVYISSTRKDGALGFRRRSVPTAAARIRRHAPDLVASAASKPAALPPIASAA
jgi:hypothetical protein